MEELNYYKTHWIVMKDGQDLHAAVRCVSTYCEWNDQLPAIVRKLNAEYSLKYPGSKFAFLMMQDTKITNDQFEEDHCL